MYELSHRRWDKADVAKYTVGDYVKELSKSIVLAYNIVYIHFNVFTIAAHAEQEKSKFHDKLNCVRSAWMLVKDKLKEHCKKS